MKGINYTDRYLNFKQYYTCELSFCAGALVSDTGFMVSDTGFGVNARRKPVSDTFPG